MEELGVAMVVYKEPSGSPRYLLLKRVKNWEGWEIPKGHLEEDDYRRTVFIELSEEAGIDREEVESVEETGEQLEWSFEEDGETVERRYRLFLVKVADDAVVDVSENPHEEHERGHFFNLRDARELITYENQLEAVESADQKLG
jgi:8-oxo-dGTP pyrophosphatase MutT (NUDIX family)